MGNPEGKTEATGDELPFEQVIAQLQSLVTQLESGSLSLEQALRVYEKGVILVGRGHSVLDNAEKRVELLISEGSRQTSQPLDDTDG